MNFKKNLEKNVKVQAVFDDEVFRIASNVPVDDSLFHF